MFDFIFIRKRKFKEKQKVIIYIISSSLGDGGSQRTLVNYANYFSKNRRCSVSFISLTKKNDYKGELNNNIKLIELNKKRSLFAFFDLIKIFIKKRPNKIISSQNHVNFLTILVSKLLFIKKRNIFLRAANTILFSQQTFFKKEIMILLIKLFYSNYNLICSSKGLGEEFKKINRKINIIVIYLSINKTDVINKSKKLNKTVNYFKNKNYILYYGRLQKHKGVVDLLEAFKLSKIKNLDLVFIGDGPLKKQIIDLSIQYDLVKTVYFLGFLKNPFPFVKYSKFCVLPSYHEGIPNVMLQCIALNKNIISYDCNYGPSEILGKDSPLLINVGNIKLLSKKMKIFAKEKKIFFNRKNILNKFDNEKNLENLSKVVNE